MSIALVVSDVDGTLVDKQKKVTPATIAAVERLRAAGIAFTIISARPMSGMLPIAEALALDGDMAAFNGGIVFRRDGSVSRHLTITPEVARGIVALTKDAPVETWVFADDRWYATDPNGPHTASERIAANQEPVAVTDLDPLLDRADKITFVSDDERQLRQLAERVGVQFRDLATIMQSQTYYLDVTALGADKGAGLGALSDAFCVHFANIAAIGDQANDLPMLKLAGRSIAMGNAPDAVKAVAHDVTRGNDEDGVAHAIDTLILSGVS
ncbi:Cof-type HAD-IIB family hydrolase [Sphingomonas sp. SUN019]|nr:Cof-type HAD-IIB family hydrolase [Sphingomonas sp. SUN019]